MKDLDKVYAESVAEEYAPKKDSKVVALRKLDNKVKLPAYIFTYTLGVLSALILGIGMCLAMHVIAPATTAMLVVGIIIGVIGIVGVSVNYPLYKKILNSRKDKYAADIIELAKSIGE